MFLRFMNIFAVAVIVLSLCGCKRKPDDEISNAGSADVTEQVAEFRVEKDSNGKYWFVDPAGKKFISIGINNVVPAAWNPVAGTDYYNAVKDIFKGDYEAWKSDAVQLLKENGFNTFGAWSDGGLTTEGMYETVCVYVAAHKLDRCLEGLRPGFEQRVRENVKLILADHPDLSRAIGVFLDNEAAWYGKSGWDDIATYTLLEVAFEQDKSDGAYRAATEYLQGKYGSVENFSRAWGKIVDSWQDVDTAFLRRCLNEITQVDRAEFTRIVAQEYFRISSKVVRQMLPGKLILGVRFAGRAPEQVVRVCGKYCDVVSFNDYRRSPEADEAMLAKYYVWGSKPLMVTEYSWRGKENNSGNPNTGGAGVVVKTQTERGENYRKYVEGLLAYPMVIGAHWFEFADQSPQGRFDGENSNYGIVDIRHGQYMEVLEAMKLTNDKVAVLHEKSSLDSPKEIAKRKEVIFEPGQHPGKESEINLIAEKPAADPELFNAPDAKISLSKDGDSLLVEYDTGNEWGCGVIFYGPEKYAVGRGPKGATDLDGYSTLLIEADMSGEVTFEIFVDEAGTDDFQADSFNIEAGDDGESFTFEPTNGDSGQKEYVFELKNIKARTSWGNQKGQRRVDMHAIKGIAIFLHGAQGKGTISLNSVKFIR